MRRPRGGRSMSSACPRALLAALLVATPAAARELRVCADPNNLPFSNAAEEGFENRIMQVLAQDMGATLSYTWHAQRRGFVRETLKAGLCDIVAGTAAGMDMLRTTAPYYRSFYVFAAREDRGLRPDSLDDPLLHELTIGVQVVGEVSLVFDSMTGPLPQVRAGRLKALGLTGAKRAPVLPDVPTATESGIPV